MPQGASVSVRPLTSSRDRKRFVQLPWELYANDVAWVPPLRLLALERISPSKNPYFEHADAEFFLAERAGKIVGRISAQVCSLSQLHHGEGVGHFGLFDCENSAETAAQLFEAAERWLKDKGMSRLLGPFDLSINDEAGMLVTGFQHPPYVLMGHHHAYYTHLLENAGLCKAMDLHAYYLDISREYTSRIDKIVRRAAGDQRISINVVEKKDFARELRVVLDIFRESWCENWGYVPPTDKEVDYLVCQIRPLLQQGCMVVANVDGEQAGFMIVLPNINELISDLNGRLFPIGWLKLLWRLRFAVFKSVRVPLMGMRKKYQSSRIGASTALLMIDRCRALLLPRGVTDCEMSWVLESNTPMRAILDAAGCQPYKSYRIFQKTLTATPAKSRQ